jgi:hypothetical protein
LFFIFKTGVKKKGGANRRPLALPENSRLSRWWSGGFFRPGRVFFAFEIAQTAFSFLGFIVLFAHNVSLHRARVAILWCAL